jgi:hypothetical protein
MRRWRGRMFSAATLLSSLLLVATGALWLRSRYVSEIWSRPLTDVRGRYVGDSSLHVYSGGIGFAHVRLDSPVPAAEPIDGQVIHRSWHQPNLIMLQSAFYLPYQQYAGFMWGNLRGSIWISLSGWSRDPMGASGYYVPEFERFFIVPFHALFLTWALLPTIWLLRHWYTRRRHRAGTCQVCGYDLRATPERCPECGRETLSPAP